jgi:hypothetical protein
MSTPVVPPPVDRAVDATNAQNTQAFLDVFTADGAVDDWGRVFEGHAAIKQWSDRELIGVHASLRVTGVDQDGDQVTVTAEVGGEGFNGPSHFTFTIKGDKVSRMRITA